MKKLFCAVVATLLAVQLCVPVFAADVSTAAETPDDNLAYVTEQGLKQKADSSAFAQSPAQADQNAVAADTNTPAAVAALAPNQTVDFAFDRYDSNMIYNITIPAPGYISLYLANDVVAGGKWSVLLQSTEYYEVVREEYASDVAAHSSMNVGVGAGTYQVRITQSSVPAANRKGSFRLDYTASENREAEPNGGYNLATPISLKKTITGTANISGNLGDVDWYKVNVNTQGVLRVALDTNKVAAGKWSYAVYGSDVEQPASRSLDYKDFFAGSPMHKTTPLGVKKGTYYIRVAASAELYGENYNLTATVDTTKLWEVEENSKYTAASKLSFGQPAYGTFGGTGDQDWFKVSVPKSGEYVISFSNPRFNKKDSYFLGVYEGKAKAKKSSAKRFISWKKANDSLKVNLKAGDCYIYLSGYPKSDHQEPYSVTVSAAGKAVSSFKLSPNKTQLLTLANKNKRTTTLKISAISPAGSATAGRAYWSSNNPNVASVTQKGKVTAVGKGRATITCTIGGASRTCVIQVK